MGVYMCQYSKLDHDCREVSWITLHLPLEKQLNLLSSMQIFFHYIFG